MIRVLGIALLVLGATSSSHAETENLMFKTRDTVTNLAFDPAKFFADESRGQDLIRFAYRGDDWAWPVYSIAIRNGCSAERRKDCQLTRRARMVRAPAVEKMERPRWRGTALIRMVADQKPSTPADVSAILDTVGMEWMEADLKSCPNAMSVLAEGNNLVWVLPETLAPSPDAKFESVLHADTLSLEFPYYLRKVRYTGYLAEGSPPAWANKLAQTLEPCWQPAKATAPWHQSSKSRD